MDIDSVRPIKKKQYVPRGQTALLDAIGNTLTYFINKKISDVNAYDSCLVYIITDGYENASKHFTQRHIKDLIVNAETHYNIKIVYISNRTESKAQIMVNHFKKNIPDSTFLFAWNHKKEIFKKEKRILKKTKWFAHVKL